jgi:hypothetical protein
MSAIPTPNLIPDDYSKSVFYHATGDWESLDYYEDMEWENFTKHVSYRHEEEYFFVFLTPYFNETTDKRWTIMALEVGTIGNDIFLDNMEIIGFTDVIPDFKGKNSAAQKIKKHRLSNATDWGHRFFLQIQPSITPIKKYINLTINEERAKAPNIIEKF